MTELAYEQLALSPNEIDIVVNWLKKTLHERGANVRYSYEGICSNLISEGHRTPTRLRYRESAELLRRMVSEFALALWPNIITSDERLKYPIELTYEGYVADNDKWLEGTEALTRRLELVECMLNFFQGKNKDILKYTYDSVALDT